VITRAENRHTGIERLIRQHNAKAPIFRSRVVVTGELPQGPVAAFCGLGQPRTFWRTLDELGISVVCRLQFPDHHRYTEADLRDIERQAAGTEALVTTEKDLMNLPVGVPLPLTIHCLRIEIEIENEAELLRHVL
jgi:tetraacyldisaccharide 4'-kinase